MKNVIAALFILIAQLGFSQKDTSTVGKNKNKIDQLNERLDRLLKGGSSEEVDSTNYKLDYIFQEIKNIKSEISEMKQSIEEIKTIDRSVLNAENAVVAIKDAQGVSAGAYYVVLASERTKEKCKMALAIISKKHKAKLVKNSKETWYHVILEEEFTEEQAGVSTAEFRKKGFSDAWWTTGKKLMQ